MLLSAPLLATQTQTVACPTDPWGNFMAWLFCDLLQAFGVQTKNLSTDMVASYLHMSVGSGNACAGLVESLGSGSCVTLNLWHATEMAGFPLVVVAMGARFMRMLTQGNYSVSPGWAFADPILRAIVAFAAITASFPVLVQAHETSLALGSQAFQAITAAGGGGTHLGASSGLSESGILVAIIQWIYGLVIFVMVLASLIGLQVCIVLAPLFIPLWVYGTDASLFSWFARTVGGGLVLPFGLGVSWAVVLVLTHQFDTLTINPVTVVLRNVMEFVVLSAGIWFMGKFVSATSGELFRGHRMLATLFFAESTLLNSMRIGGAVLPIKTREFASRHMSSLGRWAPWGLMQGSQRTFTAQRSMVSGVLQSLETNSPLRRVMAGWMGPEALKEHARIQSAVIRSAIRSGDWQGAAELTRTFDSGNWERASIDTFRRLPADQQIRLAYRAVAHERTGITRHDTAAEAAGRRALDASLGPTSLAGQEARYYRELLQHMNTAKPVPAFVRAMPGLDRLPGGNPSHTRRGSTPLPRPPTPAGDYE